MGRKSARGRRSSNPGAVGEADLAKGQVNASGNGTTRRSRKVFAIFTAAIMFLVLIAGGYILLADRLPGLGSDTAQAKAQLGTGDVQVTLRWTNAADIDLSVIDPFGEEIWFNHRTSDSGGELDLDANANCKERKLEPIENVYWPTGLAPSGEYQIYVNYFKACENTGPTFIEVIVKIDAEIVSTYANTINPEDGRVFISNFIR